MIYDIILRLVYTFSCSRECSLCAYFNDVVILWQLLFNLRRRSNFFLVEMIEIHSFILKFYMRFSIKIRYMY